MTRGSLQHLQPGEAYMSATAAIPYIAECPGCGHDAKWRDILVAIKSPTQTVRSVVQTEIECDHCGPLEIEVDES